MNAQDRLARLRVEDPTAAAAAVDALWAQLAREEPRMFAALWRRANRPSRRPAQVEVPVPVPVQWIDDEPVTIAPVVPAVEPAPAAMPVVNLTPAPAPAVPLQPTAPVAAPPPPSPLVFEPSPSLAELRPEAERTSA
jgi:hypothetical protein